MVARCSSHGAGGSEGMTTEPAPKGAKETGGETTPSSTHSLQGSEAPQPHLLHPERSESGATDS